MSFPKIHFGDVNQYATKIDETNANKKVFIFIDENTQNWLSHFQVSTFKTAFVLVLKAGEYNKNLKQVDLIWNFLNQKLANRNDEVYIIGGGVICDLAAFAISTFKRGIPFHLVPTTLLAMVDASIGGKTGFNFKNLKNNIGTFNHPKTIFCDHQFLSTLSQKEIISGMAEVFKHAIIGDPKLWEHLANQHIDSLDYEYLIPRSSNLKMKVVKADPKEEGERKKLNFGHTVGHAIESALLLSKKPTLHGFAVAFGMIAESFLSYKLNLCSLDTYMEIKHKLNVFFKPHLDFNIDEKSVFGFMAHDKKNNHSLINFSLPKKIGEVIIDVEINKIEVKSILKEFKVNG